MPRLREPGSFLPTLLLVFSGYLLLAGGGRLAVAPAR